MKSYRSYMQDYANIAEQGRNEGKTLIVKPEIYVAVHFLEDNGLTELWEFNTIARLRKIIAKCDESNGDGVQFLVAINALYDAVDEISG